MISINPIDVGSASDAYPRFLSKVDDSGHPDESCWEWTAGTFGDEYGRFALDGQYHQAHRIAWALAHDRDPGGDLVLHECHNPLCVNPLHLTLGNQRLNMMHAFSEHGPDVFSSLGDENPNAKLSEDAAREIRERYADGDEDVTQADLADEYEVSETTISYVVNEVFWSDAR